MNSECAKCKTSLVTLKRCTGCYLVSYCSKACQKAHWRDHRIVCKPASAETTRSTKSVSEQRRDGDQSSATKDNLQTNKDQPETERDNVTESKKGLCVLCNKDAEKKCSRCKQVFYCSKQCQKADWKTHKHVCQKSETEYQHRVPLNPLFSPFSPFSQFQQFVPGENLSARETTTGEKFHQAIQYARARFPLNEIIFSINDIPSEYFFFRPQTKYILVAFIPRYHHYRARHCIYIQDLAGEEIYVAFYLDFDNPFPYFSWSSVRPGRFIAIDNPCIHYFADGSVGLRQEDPSEITFIDV